MTTSDVGRPTIAYPLRDKCYLNITSRCTLRCAFCPKTRHRWVVGDANLYLPREPAVSEVLTTVGDASRYEEVVFCGLGEPTLRLYDMLEMAGGLHEHGARRVRLETDGLANLVYRRDVTPDLEGFIDAVSVSLNAQNEEIYNRYCRPTLAGAFAAVLDFTDRARDFVPDVCFTAIDGLEGVDISACEAIARGLGVRFRARRLNDIEGVDAQGRDQSPRDLI